MKNSKTIVEEYLKKQDWRVNESSSSPFSFGGLNKYITSEVSKDYWLRNVYNDDITKAYIDGYIHIHDLGGLSVYTYYGKETMIIKNPEGEILVVSFEDLYASLSEKEVCVDPKNDVWQIYINSYQVLDKNGWVNLQKLTRKAKHRDMRFIKNEAGRSVIVTDNHPMLTESCEKCSIDVNEETDKLYTADIVSLLRDEKLFYINEIDLLKELPSKIGNDKIYADSFLIDIQRENDSVQFVGTQSHCLKRHFMLTQELGFAIGFILAEGFLSCNDKILSHIEIKNKNEADVHRIVNALLEIGCHCTVNYSDEFYNISINNKIFLYILKRIWKIKSGSYNKNLPNQILMYNKSFLYGLLSGLIDGDGTVVNAVTIIRVAARTMLEQLATMCFFLDIHPRDRAIEGQGTKREYCGRTIIQQYPLYGIGFRNTNVNIGSTKLSEGKVSKSAWRSEDIGTWTKVLNNKEVNIPDEYIYDVTTESGTLLVNCMYNHNCTGYSLKDILMKGVKGVSVIPESSPAKHFDSVLNQIANLTTVFQNEILGAVAFNSVDTLLAPFIKVDNLTYDKVKQSMQNYIFSINSNSRGGAEPAFTNITLDLTPPDDLLTQYAIVGGIPMDFTYRECQKEIDMFNKAFCEIMLTGDAKGKLFSYPIPTYNISERFDWENPNNDLLWEMTGKYGVPYFANFVNSDLDIRDVRSMCCRLRLDLSKLRKRNGGLFGAGDSTGSIGVVTVNLPRIAYENRGNKEAFFRELDKYLNIAKDSLVRKREWLQTNIVETGAIPAFMEYVKTLNNHFSTIGDIGKNEMCINFMGKNILQVEAKEFTLSVGEYFKKKLIEFQDECGCLFNYEATPAESTCYRLAMIDKKQYPDIYTQGVGNSCYYTNSCHIPVNMTEGIDSTFNHQEDLQIQYTGGTVIHCWLEGAISGEQAKSIVKNMITKYKIPYMSLSPISRYCDTHGYITEITDICPHCGSKLKKYQRITGYLRCEENFNPGKKAEFKDRKQESIK